MAPCRGLLILTLNLPTAYTEIVAQLTRHHTVWGQLLILLVVGSLLGGCGSLFPRLGLSDPGHTTHEDVDALTGADTASSILRKGPATSGRVRVIELVFDVAQIDLPIDGVRHSRKIWNHVDELRVDSELAMRLGRNGLRVGAGSPDAWPAIRAILEATDAQVRRDKLVAQRGLPLRIKLASIDEAESIFSYGRDGRLVGKTFPEGDKLFDIDYAFHPQLGGCTDLRISFEIRQDHGVMTWEKRNDIIRQVPAYDQYVFSDLSVPLTLNMGEFLVVGLGDQSDNRYLIGSRFLTFERSGKRYETLLCVTPRPYQTRGVKRRPS